MDARVESPVAREAVTAGAIGNLVEWYDCSVYGFFATVLAGQFFPSNAQVASLLTTWKTGVLS